MDASFTPAGCSPDPAPVRWSPTWRRSSGGLAQRALAGLLFGAALVVLDFFIVLACLPTIEQTLGASKAQLQMVMAAYAIANGSFLVVGGRLGDALGRRRLFFLGMAGFTLASAGCGLSTSAPMLIGWRLLQGLSGALLQPPGARSARRHFEPAERQRVFGWYAAALGYRASERSSWAAS
jgi:MFS family permease